MLWRQLFITLVFWEGSSIFVPPKNPNYEELESFSPSGLSRDPAFIAACHEMSGYYKNQSRNPHLKKTIVLAGVNNGYLDFFHNFKVVRCSTTHALILRS